MPRGYPGSTPGVDPGSQGVIPRRFKRKKFFVTNVVVVGGAWTHRREGGNSGLDVVINKHHCTLYSKVRKSICSTSYVNSIVLIDRKFQKFD